MSGVGIPLKGACRLTSAPANGITDRGERRPQRQPSEPSERSARVAIRAVVFDIGGILEMGLEGGEPSAAYPQLFAAWEPRLGLAPGELAARMREVGERLASQGKNAMLGTCTEEEWLAEIGLATGLDGEPFDSFIRDSWDAYCGQPNHGLIAYFRGLCPRYQTA